MNQAKFSARQGLLDLKQQTLTVVQGDATCQVHARRLRQKRKLYLKQRGKCCFCKQMMYACFDTAPVKMLAATREHIIPRCQSQPGSGPNIAISCVRCNKIRGTIDFVLFELMALFIPYDVLPRAAKSRKIAKKYGFSL